MANMQRSAMVTELKARGWSRFADADLQRYLDWALQDLYGMAHYPRSTISLNDVVGTVLDQIPDSTVCTGGAELLHQIKAVFAVVSGDTYKLEPADEEFFFNTMWHSSLDASIDKAAVPTHYYHYQSTTWIYPKPQNAITLHFHVLIREDGFAGDTDTTGLPERFDKAVIAQAEMHCCRRAHDVEGMSVAQLFVRNFLLDELGMAAQTMEEEPVRILPWRG